MSKVKKYDFTWLPKVTIEPSLEELNKRNKAQVEAQLEGQKELERLQNSRSFTGNPIQDAIITEVADAIEQPFKTIKKGLDQLGHPRIPDSGKNPIAGAINLATGIAEVPMLIGTVPLSGINAGLDAIGLERVTEPINKTFEQIQEAPKNIAEEITQALEENGTATQIRNFVDMKNVEYGVSDKPLRIEEKQAKEINEAINNLTGLSAIVGTTVGVAKVGGDLIKNVKTQSQLKDMGYTKKEISEMKPTEAEKIVKDKIKADVEKEIETYVKEKTDIDKTTDEVIKKELVPDAEKQTSDLPSLEEVKPKEPIKEVKTEIKTDKELLESPEAPELIAVTKQKMGELRERVGLPELEKIAKQEIPQTFDKVKSEIEQGVRTPELLLKDVREGKRSPEQNFEATYYLTRENIKWERTIEKLREARKNGDKATEGVLNLIADESLSKMKEMTDTFSQAGTEWGRYGRFMQEAMAKDYSISRLTQRAEKVSPDGKVSPETKSKLENYAFEISKIKEAIDKYQTKYPDKTIEDFIQSIERKEKFEQRRTKRATTLDELKSQREVLWTDLYKATSVQAAGIPLTPEAIKVMGKLAENYVKTGIKTAEGLVDEFYNGFKGQVSREEIMKALSGYGKTTQMSKDEVKVNLRNSKREMRLLLAIEDAKKGISPQKTGLQRDVPSERVQTLQKLLNQLTKSKVDVTDAQKLKTQKTRVKNNIAEYERRLRERDYSKKERKPVTADEELTNLRVKERQLKKQVELELYREQQRNMTTWEKIKEETAKIVNIPRTLLATADLSMPLRQGLPASAANPKIAYEAFKVMHKSAGSKKYFDELMTEIENSPYARTFEKMGIQFTGIGDDLVALVKKEEAFIGSGILSRIPFVKNTLGAITEFSERGAVAYLNYMRWKMAEKHVKLLLEKGLTPENNPKVFRDVGEVINWGTGRADLGRFERIPGLANAVLFSPRTLVAKWELMNPTNYLKLAPEARNIFWKQQMATVAQGVMFLNLMKLAGAEVETDPRSSDFAKAKFGDTRIDIFGGNQQNFVLLTRIAFGLAGEENLKKTSTGNLTGKDIGELLIDYARNKLSPQASIGVDLAFGERFQTGDESFGQNIYERMIPLVWQDLLEAQAELGWGALGTTLLGFYGAGTQTFKSKEKDFNIEKLNKLKFNFDFDFEDIK